MVGICPEVLLFIFTRYISNTLALQKNREDSALSWGLPFGFLISPIFLEGVPKGSGETFERIYTRPGFDTPFRYSQQLSLLFLGSRLSGHFFGIFFWGNIGPVVSFWKGIQIFWRYCFAIVGNVAGSLLPDFWIIRPLTNIFFSYLERPLFFVAVFPLFLSEEEILI